MEGTTGEPKARSIELQPQGLGGSISSSTVTHAIREAWILNNSPTRHMGGLKLKSLLEMCLKYIARKLSYIARSLHLSPTPLLTPNDSHIKFTNS